MQSNVSRRNFFKGAGLAAVGALTAGTLSGCGQGYATADPANPSTGDFGGPSWLGAPPVIDEADIAETIDTEVLVVVEQVCDKAEDIIRNEYEKVYGKSYFTWRYGYGYGDLPLQEEKAALQLLESEKRIGVGISDSLIMFPRKTVACIIGISKTEIKSSRKGCISCNMRERCKFRQRGERCGF